MFSLAFRRCYRFLSSDVRRVPLIEHGAQVVASTSQTRQLAVPLARLVQGHASDATGVVVGVNSDLLTYGGGDAERDPKMMDASPAIVLLRPQLSLRQHMLGEGLDLGRVTPLWRAHQMHVQRCCRPVRHQGLQLSAGRPSGLRTISSVSSRFPDIQECVPTTACRMTTTGCDPMASTGRVVKFSGGMHGGTVQEHRHKLQ